MAKFYALDNKLMCGGPEVRIGDRVYSVDDRKKTVVKMMDCLLYTSNKQKNSSQRTAVCWELFFCSPFPFRGGLGGTCALFGRRGRGP